MIQAIVFDLGNVLVEYREQEILNKLSRWGNWDIAVAKEHLQKVREELYSGRLNMVQWHDALIEQLQLPPSFDEFRSAFCSGLGRDPMAIQYLARLRAEFSLSMAVISNICDGHDEWVRSNLREIEDFELVIFSHEVGLFKPEPEIFHLTAERLGLQPAQMIFIDDLLENAEAAASLGWHAIHHKDWRETYPKIVRLLQI